MSKSVITILFTALLVTGALASSRSLQSDKAADAAEHFRILEELEQVHQLRERMLQEGTTDFICALGLMQITVAAENLQSGT